MALAKTARDHNGAKDRSHDKWAPRAELQAAARHHRRTADRQRVADGWNDALDDEQEATVERWMISAWGAE